MPYPRVIPHSDGAGYVDAVGEGVSSDRLGERVWVYGAQSYRPFGTAAELVVVPQERAIPLPHHVDLAIGACLGVSARTAHRCVFADGPVQEQMLLIAGGAGNVGHAAVVLARWGGARVLATISSADDQLLVEAAGATNGLDRHAPDLARQILGLTDGRGVDRIIEVTFGENIALDEQVIATNGIIAAYSSDAAANPVIPFWPLLFKNAVVRLIGSDDLPSEAEEAAVREISARVSEGNLVPRIDSEFSLDEIADAHDRVDRGPRGHVLIKIADV